MTSKKLKNDVEITETDSTANIETDIAGVGREVKNPSKLTGAHVFVISKVPNKVAFMTKRVFDYDNRIDGLPRISKEGKLICEIKGTHTNKADKNTVAFQENVVAASVWEEVLAHNAHCNYFKNGNITWYNSHVDAMEAGEAKDFDAYTGLERIDSSKLKEGSVVQHRPMR